MRKRLVSSLTLGTALMMAVPAFAEGTPAATDPAVDDAVVVETPDTGVTATAPEGFTATSFDAVSAEQLTGARILDDKGADLGEVSDIVLGDGDKVTGIVTDIGGFLGIGEHSVLLNPDQVEIYTNADGEVRVHLHLTEDELKALPAYEAD